MNGYLFGGNTVLIWNSTDVSRLRADHRIVGGLIGSLPTDPRQNNQLGLPLMLMPEEACLLMELDVLRLKKFKDLTNMLSSEQLDCFRKLVLERDNTCSMSPTNEKLKMAEQEVPVNRAVNFHPSVSIHTEYPFDVLNKVIKQRPKHVINESTDESFSYGDCDNVDTSSGLEDTLPDAEWAWPQTVEQIDRYRIFKDLWQKGYYLTSGLKFGGDYLVYENDPFIAHASFIAKIVKWDEVLTMLRIVTAGRLGGKVKKRTLLCSVNPVGGLVQYMTLSWSGSTGRHIEALTK